jgi:hypothetical protein
MCNHVYTGFPEGATRSGVVVYVSNGHKGLNSNTGLCVIPAVHVSSSDGANSSPFFPSLTTHGMHSHSYRFLGLLVEIRDTWPAICIRVQSPIGFTTSNLMMDQLCRDAGTVF